MDEDDSDFGLNVHKPEKVFDQYNSKEPQKQGGTTSTQGQARTAQHSRLGVKRPGCQNQKQRREAGALGARDRLLGPVSAF